MKFKDFDPKLLKILEKYVKDTDASVEEKEEIKKHKDEENNRIESLEEIREKSFAELLKEEEKREEGKEKEFTSKAKFDKTADKSSGFRYRRYVELSPRKKMERNYRATESYLDKAKDEIIKESGFDAYAFIKEIQKNDEILEKMTYDGFIFWRYKSKDYLIKFDKTLISTDEYKKNPEILEQYLSGVELDAIKRKGQAIFVFKPVEIFEIEKKEDDYNLVEYKKDEKSDWEAELAEIENELASEKNKKKIRKLKARKRELERLLSGEKKVETVDSLILNLSLRNVPKYVLIQLKRFYKYDPEKGIYKKRKARKKDR